LLALVAVTDSSKVPGGWPGFWLGILVTAGLVAALVAAWPADEDRVLAATQPITPTTGFGVGVVIPELPELPAEVPGETAQLFASGLPEAVAEVVAAAGGPTELLEVAVYPSYVYVTYRDAVDADAVARSVWRDGTVRLDEPAALGPLDLAELFTAADLDLARIPSLIADAPTHYPFPGAVSHVLIDRFLPFDDRVLVRVYVLPREGDPSEAGYVSYTADGTLVTVCC
jgi:hypothetical protein